MGRVENKLRDLKEYNFYPSCIGGAMVPRYKKGIGVLSISDLDKIVEIMASKYRNKRDVCVPKGGPVEIYKLKKGYVVTREDVDADLNKQELDKPVKYTPRDVPARVSLYAGDRNDKSNIGLLDLLKETPEIWEKIFESIVFINEGCSFLFCSE